MCVLLNAYTRELSGCPTLGPATVRVTWEKVRGMCLVQGRWVNEQHPASTGRHHVLHTTAADMSSGGASLWAGSFVRGVAPKKSD